MIARWPRRLVLLLGVIAALAVAPTAASAVTITTPAEGSALNGPPTQFVGEGSMNFFVYSLEIGVVVRAADATTGNDLATFYNGWNFLDIDGVYDLPRADLTRNPSYFPDSKPFDEWYDGYYSAEALQICALGCAFEPFIPGPGSDSAKTHFWVDTWAPDTTVDSATPPSPTNATTRTFTFSGTDGIKPGGGNSDPTGVDRYECSVDGGAFATCTSPFTTPTLTEGNHSFAVRAVDRAGNTDATHATSAWVLDTTKPTVDIVRPATRGHYVLDEYVTASYSCDDPLSSGVASGVASCVGTVPNGSPFDTSTLGPHLFTVTAIDNAGNTHSETIAYVVDPPRYGDYLLNDDPIAYYRLGDSLGSGSMADSSGHGHHGEYKNGIALQRPAAIACERRPHPPAACETANDPQDWAAFFPARDGYGFANEITAPRDAYTLEAWVKPAHAGDMSIAGQGGGGQLFISGGRLALRQTQDTIVAPGPSIPVGEWTHVAASWDGHTTRLFVNGVQVATSTTANKPPSGKATLYVGYGDQAPWFHGDLDEVAYYGSAVPVGKLRNHYLIGTAFDHPSLGPGNTHTARPNADAEAPANNGLYAPTKVPVADFECSDPDGPADVASCTATVDGNPIADGVQLPSSVGSHTFVITAVDQAGLSYVHTHTYTVKSFSEIVGHDVPIAYYRLGDGADGAMIDQGSSGRTGTYKNRQESGPVGIAGDGDKARRFFGSSGYGFVSSIPAPRFQSTIEAWANPDDGRDQTIVDHGDAGALIVKDGLFAFRHMDRTVTAHLGPTPGQWSQIVGVWDGVTISIYVDGESHGSLEATKRPSSASTFYVGYGELAPWFAGSIDEVAYYDIALTPARVFQHWLADPPPAVDGPTDAVGTDPSPDGSAPAQHSAPAAPNTTASAPASSAPVGAKAKGSTKPARSAQARCKKLKSAKKRRACQRKAKAAQRSPRG